MKKTIIVMLFSFSSTVLNAQYSEFHLSDKEMLVFQCETPIYSPFLEYGLYYLDKSDTSLFYIQKKIAYGHFSVESLPNFSDFYIPKNLVKGNIICLYNDRNLTDYFLIKNETHIIPYIKYYGILVLLLNDLDIPCENYTITSGTEFYDKYIRIFFDLVNIHRKG